MNSDIFKDCQKIRSTEEHLLELFSQGKMNGTIHTCVGQELASYFLIKALEKDDYIFSNHRCHGHYLHRFDDIESLIAELMGKRSGVCSGIGSSQHICRDVFFSNGLQGGIVPLAAGASFQNKLNKRTNIAVVFIGDGTLGEGAIYETFNIASLLELPLLVVCEDNGIAQSTRKENSFRGSLESRCKGFGLKYFHSEMWDEDSLSLNSKKAIDFVRSNSMPALLHIDTYRLNSHSKSDDNRNPSEVEEYKKIDPLLVFSREHPKISEKISKKISKQIDVLINKALADDEIQLEEYVTDHFSQRDDVEIDFVNANRYGAHNSEKRVSERINDFFHDLLAIDNRAIFIGEDVADPYGGAFKVSKGLSDKYPNRVFSTPISEQAISGVANGLAITGMKPYLEIMFGDFITLAFDQLLNHASKFYYMYDKQVTCPVVIRTPVGGGRGYGPTHSQSIEKLVVGLDCVRVVAIDAFRDPYRTYAEVHQTKHPVVIIENKTGYGRYLGELSSDFYRVHSCDDYLGNTRICPTGGESANTTVVTYGESASRVAELLDLLFESNEIVVDMHILTSLYPLNLDDIIKSAERTKKVLVLEESSAPFGIGAEVSSLLNEVLDNVKISRLGAIPVPIPSVRSLEESVLNINTIESTLRELNK